MFGGSPAAAREIEPLMKILAPAPDQGWLHCGASGSGHFVKMIHNGIEYGMMQALAEGFALMSGKHEFELDVAAIAEMWRHGSVVRSWLLDLTADFLREDADLNAIAPVVADSGEGRWTVDEAIEQGVPAPVLSLALLRALRKPGQGRLRRQAARHDAQGLRRAQGHEGHGRQRKMIVVLMGVCGCGKTTVGRALAQELGWTFVDADDLHPSANVAKMASGVPLTDEDRWPWLERIGAELQRLTRSGKHVVLACSALKEAYRERLARAGDLRIVYLKGDAATIEPRIASRSGHLHAGVAAGEPVRRAGRACRRDRRRHRATHRGASGCRSRALCAKSCRRERRQEASHAARQREVAHLRPHAAASTSARSTRRSTARRRFSSTRSPTWKPPSAANIPESPTACTACRPSPICRRRSRRSKAGMPRSPSPRDSPRSRSRCSATTQAGDHVLVTDSVYGPTRRFCDNQLTRFGVEVSYYDPLHRRRHRARDARQHARGVRRVAGIADLRGAGRAGDRGGRASRAARSSCSTTPGRRRSASAAFAHGVDVSLHAGTKYLGGHSDVLIGLIVCNEATYPAAAPAVDRYGRHRLERRLLPRAARVAHARGAAAAAPGSALEIARMAARAAGSRRGASSGAAGRARSRAVETRFHRRVRTVRRDPASPSRRRASTRCSNGMRLFSMGWSWGGFESLIIRANVERARRAIRAGTRAGRTCACTSASKTPTT